jgi:hypothetical protein
MQNHAPQGKEILQPRAPGNFSAWQGSYGLNREVKEMLKKTMVAMFGLVFALMLMAPAKANAAVVVGVRPAFGVGVTIAPVPYGYPAPAPYVYPAPAPYAVYGPGYVYAAPRVVFGYRPGWRGYGWRR